MKNVLTLIMLSIATLASGQGKQQRTVADFSAVSAATGIEVELTQGNENAVSVTVSDEKYSEGLITEVEKGVLRIYYKTATKMYRDKNRKLQAFVTYRSLNKISGSSGAGIVSKNAVMATAFSLDMSSGSNFSGEIKATDLKIDQSSGAISNVSGSAANVKADVSSGGIFRGNDLNAENCKASVSTGGMLRITVNKKLTAKASTGGMVYYKGDPEVQKSLRTGGEVSKK
ncbi:MAG: head GIN domain-containing protein [Ferruginibacter sp.]